MKTTGQSLHYTGGCTPSDVNSNPWKREKEGGKEGKRKRERRGERERKESFQGIKLQNRPLEALIGWTNGTHPHA